MSGLNVNTGASNFLSTGLLSSAVPSTTTGLATVFAGSKITSMQNEGTYTDVYIAKPGQPAIPVPIPNNDPNALANLKAAMAAAPNNLLTSANSAVTNASAETASDQFLDAMNEKISQLSDEQIAQIGGGLSREQVEQEITFAILFPDADLPAAIMNEAATIASQVQSQTGVSASQIDPSFIQMYEAAMSYGQDAMVQSALMSDTSLSAADRQEIISAWKLGTTNLLPANLQAALQSALSSSQAVMEQQFGCPSDWQISNGGSTYTTGLATAYSQQFDQALQSALQNGTITQDQYYELQGMFYLGNTSSDPTLNSLLQSIENPILQNMQDSYGFPPGYTPTPNSTSFTNYLDGSFLTAFQNLVSAYTPPLTAAQQTQLANALTSTNAENALPADLKAIFMQLKGQTLQQIVQKYNLPGTWAPDPDLLEEMLSGNPSVQESQNGIQQMNEWVAGANQYVATSVSNGTMTQSQGLTYNNFLKIVSEALAALQSTIYSVSVRDAQLNRIFSEIQNDMQMTQLNEQQVAAQAEAAQQAAQASKQNTMNIFSDIFQWVANVILAVVCPVLFIALMVHAAQSGQGTSSQGWAGFSVVSEAITCMEQIGQALGIPNNVAVILGTILMLLCPFTALAVIADTVLGNGDFMTNFLEACGVPSSEAQTITMIYQIVVQVILAILLTIFTMGAGAISFAEIGANIAKLATSAVRCIAEKGFQVAVQTAFRAILDSLQTLGKAIWEGLKEFFQTLAKNFVKFFKDFASTVKDLFTDFKGTMQKFVQWIKTSWQEFKDSTAIQNIQKLVNTATTFAQTAKGVEGAINNIIEGQIDLLNATLDLIAAQLKADIDLITQLLTSVNQFIQSIQNSMKNDTKMLQSIGDQMQSMWESLGSAIQGLAIPA